MSLTLELYGDIFPAKYEVCERCRGTGKHVNPAVDGNGITQSEMDELGDDFREDYLGGVYDVLCEECHGDRVVLILDEEIASQAQIEAYRGHLQDAADYRAEILAERRMGA